jgi:aminoglycoside 6'-N-acetyltransferase I
LRVRLIGPGDLATWCRMRVALWPAEPEGDLIRDAEAHLQGAGALQAVFLCEAAPGQPLGMIELSLRSYADGCRSMPVPYVEGWYVVPEARRGGVGRALMAAAERWARARGYTEIASDALLENRESERAHLALGFAEVERAIRFRKDLERSGSEALARPANVARSK